MFTGAGSRWIISNPFLATDSGIVLVRMYNNNSGVSSAVGKLVVMYIKKETIGNI